ncbi:hypothetical protein G7046_g6079 [Stylonectria norvegica]|nr:hypothetical protein G7046_g6079 [Stylonectria norvegica]
MFNKRAAAPELRCKSPTGLDRSCRRKTCKRERDSVALAPIRNSPTHSGPAKIKATLHAPSSFSLRRANFVSTTPDTATLVGANITTTTRFPNSIPPSFASTGRFHLLQHPTTSLLDRTSYSLDRPCTSSPTRIGPRIVARSRLPQSWVSASPRPRLRAAAHLRAAANQGLAAPKKKEQQQKMSLGDFLTDSGSSGFGGGSWADEVEETYVAGSQPLPSRDRGGAGGYQSTSTWQDRGYSVREETPQTLPTKPPYTAHLGNLAYEVTDEAIGELFEGCDVATVRLIEDRETMRPKGFGYVEFGTLDGLKKALTLDGENFGGRTVRIKIADPPRGGDSGRGDTIREMGNWTRSGPLSGGPDPPRGAGGRQPSDFGERRAPRDSGFGDDRPAREARDLTWERRGPLPAVANPEGSGSRDGSRPRRAPEGLANGVNRTVEEPVYPERAERVATAADSDMKWRERMRPAEAKPTSPDGSAPPSPALSSAGPAAPGGRPRLNLAKRTVSEAQGPASPTTGGDAKASPFGAARPIDTAAREKEIEEKRLQAIQDKRDADEKAKEDRRLAKEAEAEAKKEADAKKDAEAKEAEEAAAAEPKVEAEPAQEQTEEQKTEEKSEPKTEPKTEQKAPARTREPREPKEALAICL